MILYQKDIRTVLRSTQVNSGIRKFSNKFSSTQMKSTDVLLRIHDLAERYKEISWASFILASKANMLAVLAEGALVVSRDLKIPKKYECASINPLLIGADKLGAWFAKNSLYDIASNLRVRF
ncbi:three component ABC system middle component [Humidesulfovibrio sp.]|uniref:three component ABC system middle component n=1 Tax=Humidesulfovibrio sp. TaxID=2910988 RepID=UPI003523B60F